MMPIDRIRAILNTHVRHMCLHYLVGDDINSPGWDERYQAWWNCLKEETFLMMTLRQDDVHAYKFVEQLIFDWDDEHLPLKHPLLD